MQGIYEFPFKLQFDELFIHHDHVDHWHAWFLIDEINSKYIISIKIFFWYCLYIKMIKSDNNV